MKKTFTIYCLLTLLSLLSFHKIFAFNFYGDCWKNNEGLKEVSWDANRRAIKIAFTIYDETL